MPSEEALKSVATLPELFQQTVRAHPDQVALRDSEGVTELTWRQYADRVQRIARGLARLGVQRGDTVALMLTNCPEFHLVDTAVLHLGATPVSVYNTSSVPQVARLFANAGNRVAVTERQWADTVRRAGGAVEHIVCVDADVDGTTSLADLEIGPDGGFDFEAAWKAVEPEDLATIIYTSGTTGHPKGVELEHRALIACLRSGLSLPHLAAAARAGRLVSYLPDAHVANRFFGHYLGMASGASITTVADLKSMAQVLPGLRPTVFLGVPAFWYKMQVTLDKAIAAQSSLRGSLVRWAVGIGRAVAQRRTSGRPVSAYLAAQHALADRAVLRNLREMIGLDQTEAAFTGAAPINAGTVWFFMSIGIQLCDGWAMSESAAAGSINRPGGIRPGTVGRPMPGVEVKVAEDGELLLRSPTLMRGYRADSEQSAQTIDAEGWLHTGDVGVVSEDGYVTVVDRKKELIINSYGKNLSPAAIESAVAVACPLVSSVIAVGDRRPYITALVTLDPVAARTFAEAQDLPGDHNDLEALAQLPQIQAEVEAGIAQANTTLSRVEQVKYVRILPAAWTPGSEELTPTNKLRRRAIMANYADEIDALYRHASGPAS